MFKKYLSPTLVLLLLVPAVAEAKSMFEENFEREQKELKSGKTALLGSFAATLAPIAAGGLLLSGGSEEFGLSLAFAGLLVGPSAGHFYAGQTKRGMTGMGIRLLVAAGGAYFISHSEEHHPDSGGWAFAYTGWIVGGVMLLHGIYDICTTPSSVRKYNKSVLEESTLKVVPEVDPFNESYGLSVVYTF